MKKTSRFYLDEVENAEFDIIGICTTLNDYRIAWLLNHTFEWALKHSLKPIQIQLKKSASNDSFDYFWHKSVDESHDVYLLKNKQHGKSLSHEFPQLDYLLLVQNNLTIDILDLVQTLREQDQIMAAYKYKSTDFLVSDLLQFE